MRQVVDCVLEDNDLGAFMAGAMSANASMILLNNSVFGTLRPSPCRGGSEASARTAGQ